MKIAYVINSVEGGGAALPVPSICDVLRKGSAEVRIFALTRRDGRAIGAMTASGLDVTVREGAETDHVAALRWLHRQMRDWQPTLIWTSLTRATLLGQLVGKRQRIPVVSWQHAAYLKPANRHLLRMMQRLSALWVGDSESVTRLTAERLGIGPGRLMTWPIFRADPHAPQAVPWQPGGVLRIGALGRLHPVKGYDVLVDALGRLRHLDVDYEVTIGGDGVERTTLEAAASARGITRLRFAGYVDQPRDFLAGLHLYLQPSRSEGFCIAAHEAMQAGLPVIASAVGELPFTIEQGRNGLIVPPRDAEALAHALGGLLADPARLADMGRNARKTVLERFGPDSFEAAGRAVLARAMTLQKRG